MKKYISVFIISCFIISCSNNDQYVYENVGTTSAIVVVEKAPAKVKKSAPTTQKQVPQVEKKAPAPLIEKKMPATPLVEKKTPAPKLQPKTKKLAFPFGEDMGTQDSDWIDIAQNDALQSAPPRKTYRKSFSPEKRSCGSCSSSCGSRCAPKRFYPSTRGGESSNNTDLRLRRLRSLPR